jgi:hypothetical protein
MIYCDLLDKSVAHDADVVSDCKTRRSTDAERQRPSAVQRTVVRLYGALW